MKCLEPILELNKGEVICPKCNGKSIFFGERLCGYCDHYGKLNWIDNLIKNKDKEYWNAYNRNYQRQRRNTRYFLNSIFEDLNNLTVRNHEDIIMNDDVINWPSGGNYITGYIYGESEIIYSTARSPMKNFICLYSLKYLPNFTIKLYDEDKKQELLDFKKRYFI